MVLRYLIRKEFLQIRRNAFLPRLILVFPIMTMCVMPWVMNMEVKNIVVNVVDNDRSSISSQLVGRIESSGYFILGGQKQSYQEALGEVENSKADLVVEIPQNFERDILRGERPQILVAANAVNGTKGSIIRPIGLSALSLQQAFELQTFHDTVAISHSYHDDVWFSACS